MKVIIIRIKGTIALQFGGLPVFFICFQFTGLKIGKSVIGTSTQACAGYRSPYPYPISGIGVRTRTRTRTRSGTGTIVCTRTRIPEIPDLPENFKNSKNIDKIKFRRKNSSSKVQQSSFRKSIVFCLRK